MSEAAALTEQIAGLLGEHVLAFSAGRCTCSCGSFERVWHYDNGKASHKDHRAHIAEVLAARLADSRPVVSEAAIEAAWTQWWYEAWPHGTEPKAEKAFKAGAKWAAALPHMGDGRGDAWDEGWCAGVSRFTQRHLPPADNPYRLSPTGDDTP